MNSKHLMQWIKAGNTARKSAIAVQEMDPLSRRSNPWIAFALGFCFGAIGVAIYLKSWKDLFVCMGLFIMLALAMPTGPGELMGWFFSPIYGAWRAYSSNDNLVSG
ncbi:MAG: hypothetical protein WA655_03850 [Candidatus Korobacteraceae bacterium]